MSQEHHYNLVDHENQFNHGIRSIEGDVVNELPSSPKTMSLFDEFFLFLTDFFRLRNKRYDQIRYWFRTFIEFSSIFCFFGFIIMMAILS